MARCRQARALALVGILVCCSNSSGTSIDDPVDAGATDGPVNVAHCGLLEHRLLEVGTMGRVLDSDRHDPLSIAEANVARGLLGIAGLWIERSAEYETQLHEIRYQTQDRGNPIEATGFVIVPQVDEPQEFPVLLFLHGTTGLNDSCAPSRELDDSDSDNFKAALLLSVVSSFGYVVVAPDYIGLKATGSPSPDLHPYLIAEPTAMVSWDAVRAGYQVLAADDSGMASGGPVVIWGASQGGHAAAFAARYASTYAPEISVKGGVYVVPPLDLAAHWQAALGRIQAATGFMVMWFAAVADWYGVDDGLSRLLVEPYDSAVGPALRVSCRPDTLDAIAEPEELFTEELLLANIRPSLGSLEPWSCLVEENSLPTHKALPVSDIPALVVLGEQDSLVDPAVERAAFNEMCSQGANWSYLECDGAGHTEAFTWSFEDSLDFLDARLAGEPMTSPCVISSPTRCSNTP